MSSSAPPPSTEKAKGIEGSESCSWFDIQYLVKEVAKQIQVKNTEEKTNYDVVLGIANGGIIPAKLLAEELGIDVIQLIPVRKKQVIISEMLRLDKNKRYLIVDDIYDTGDICNKVMQAMKGYKCDYAFCMSRYEQDIGVCGKVLNHNRWIVFPWEQRK